MQYIYRFFESIMGFVEKHHETGMPIVKGFADVCKIFIPLALFVFFASSPWLIRFILKDQKRVKISKRIIAHMFCLLLDVVAVFAVWFGIQNTVFSLMYINAPFDIVNISLMGGYMFIFLAAPAFHALVVLSHCKPGFVKKHSTPISAIALGLMVSLSWFGYYIQDNIRSEYEDRYYARCAFLEKKHEYPMYAVYLRDAAQCDVMETNFNNSPPITLTEEDKEYNRNAKVIVIE